MQLHLASRLIGASNDTRAHQNGKHLLGPSQGGEDEHDEMSPNKEELKQLKNVAAGMSDKV